MHIPGRLEQEGHELLASLGYTARPYLKLTKISLLSFIVSDLLRNRRLLIWHYGLDLECALMSSFEGLGSGSHAVR